MANNGERCVCCGAFGDAFPNGPPPDCYVQERRIALQQAAVITLGGVSAGSAYAVTVEGQLRGCPWVTSCSFRINGAAVSGN